jgi:FkbM family methyltransferase
MDIESPEFEFDGLPTFQFRKLAKAFPLIPNFRHAVDIGAHVGTWSRVLAACFRKVTAFEPMAPFRECFERNIKPEDRHRVTLHPCALGTEVGEVRMAYKPRNSGITHIRTGDAVDGDPIVQIRRLDDFGLTEVDFIKTDTEGFEYNVILGGEQTIKRCRPTMIVEQKPSTPGRYGFAVTQAVELLQTWGATLEFEWSGDYCLRWKK